jgi:hypothetical protein
MPNNHDQPPTRRPEGKEGAGAHQEGRHATQAGQTNSRGSTANQKREHDLDEHGSDHSQHRPDQEKE